MNNIIMSTIFGSHLYGTNTKDSDTDYKGIYLPSVEELLLNKIKKSYNSNTKKTNVEGVKNTSNDVDKEYYSIWHFIDLACAGRMDAFDILHAPKDKLINNSPFWDRIVANKEKFYTKNLNSFVDYVKKQAYKYGIKGSMINALKEVISIFDTFNNPMDDFKKLKYTIWPHLPDNKHCYYLSPNLDGICQYKVCGKIIQDTMTVKYTLNILRNMFNKYGDRAKQAAENKGIDWKAVSHAFRAAYQVKELFTKGTITFPLPMADFLIDVKLGRLDYKNYLAPMLEILIDVLKELSEKSSLPDKVDIKFWNELLLDELSYYYNDKITKYILSKYHNINGEFGNYA